MNTYPHYKRSGVEWLGEIPDHWHVRAFKRCVRIESGLVDPRLPEYSGLRLIAPNHVESGTGRLLGTETAAEQGADSGKYLFGPGDVIYSKIRPALAKACIPSGVGLCSADMYPLTPEPDVDARFLLFTLIWDGFTDQAVLSSERVAMPKVNRDTLGALWVAVPPIFEQRQLADYLDRKTAEIDALIQRKRALIDLLREQRRAVITRAVTKGIDSGATMKDSGIEWLGEVPKHWEATRLRYLIKDSLKYGANESADQDNPDHPRYIRITDFGSDGTLRDGTFRSLPPQVANDYLLSEGDILFARSGATVGKTFHFKNYAGHACFAGYLIKASPDNSKITSDFLYYFTQSISYQNWKNSVFIQSTIQNIGADKYQNISVPKPPIKEQMEIVRHLDERIGRIDDVVKRENDMVRDLQELRSSLISEVVTGKIDVRGGASAEPITATEVAA